LTQLKLSENVVIGNFLYGLGFAISAKSKATVFPSIVSLLQQNPMDKPLGDVLLEFTEGIVRLIEFKNKKSDHKKERKKNEILTEDLQRMIVDEALKGMGEHYTNISKSIHWFVETDPKANDFVSRIVPYLEAYPGGDTRNASEEYRFAEFVNLTADHAVNKKDSFSEKDLTAYLSHIANLQIGKNKDGSKKKIPESSGVLLMISPSGKLKVAGLPNMMHLKLQHSEYIQQMLYQQNQEYIQQPPQIEKALEQTPNIEYHKQKNLGLSL
jgi:hypothetical protein